MADFNLTGVVYPGIRVNAYANPDLTFQQVPITRFQQSVTPSDTDTKTIEPVYSDIVTATDVFVYYDGLALFEALTASEARAFLFSSVASPDAVTPSETDAKTFSIPDLGLGLDSVTISEVIELLWGRTFFDSVTASEAIASFVASHDLTDSATASEALSRVVSYIRDSISDSVTASETSDMDVTVPLPGDSVTALEAASLGFGSNLADSVSASEALVLTFTLVPADSVTATENLTPTLSPASFGGMNAAAVNTRAFNQ